GCLDTAMAQNNTISVSPTSLTFCVPTNTSAAPPAQTLTVSSTGAQPVGYNGNAFPSWILLNGVNSVVGSTSANPTITVTINPGGYSGVQDGGSATGTIQVNSGSTFLSVQVTVNVTSTCSSSTGLTANPTTVTLTP